MNILLVLDDNNYTTDMPIVQKQGARGVILRDGKLAVQKGKAGDCKILGGGMEGTESAADSLYREVLEEAGLYIIKDKVKELGTIVERRQDLYKQGVLYCCNTTYYLCEIEERTTVPNLTPSEIAKGYELAWVTPEEVIHSNQAFLHQPWIKRDTMFVEMLPNILKE